MRWGIFMASSVATGVPRTSRVPTATSRLITLPRKGATTATSPNGTLWVGKSGAATPSDATRVLVAGASSRAAISSAAACCCTKRVV